MSSRDISDLTLEEKASLTSGSTTWLSTAVADFVDAITLSDGPHGLRRQADSGDNLGIGSSLPAVCFPPAVGLSATWNRELVERVGEQLGAEARALNVQVLLGPGLNIKRSPLGGRNFEYFSEDPHLSGRLAAAMVTGIQSQGVAATPKHFAVNNQETDRMRVSAEVSERALREIYLPAFEHVVTEAKPWALMSAYNKVNGVYASESSRLLTDILRDEWGFDGVVVSDWGAVNDRVGALLAGLDLEMPPTDTDARIVRAVRDGLIDEEVVDVAVKRWQSLVKRTARPRGERDIIVAQTVALEAAREGVTLLTNDGILPLSEPGRVLVVGEFARTPRFQGGGSSRVVPTRETNALDNLRTLMPDSTVKFTPGFVLVGDPDISLADEAIAAAADADVILAFIGLSDRAESEGFDRPTLALPADQLALLTRLFSTGAPVVVVLSNGSVVDVSPFRNRAAAVLEAWLLGQEGGQAIAEVLCGVVNPSGKLAETVPHALTDSPSHPTFPGADGVAVYGDDVFVGYRGFDVRGTPVAFPFGHGLSYTSFAYSNLRIASAGDNLWTVSATIENTGSRSGAEVVQLYVGAPTELALRAPRELRGFTKVHLEPGQKQEVTFCLNARDLSRWNSRENRWQVDAGTYRVEVAASSRDIRLSDTVESSGDGVVDPLRVDSTVTEWQRHPATRPLVEAMRAQMPHDVLERAPELAAMVAEIPVMKLTTFGLGLTEESIRSTIADANAGRP